MPPSVAITDLPSRLALVGGARRPSRGVIDVLAAHGTQIVPLRRADAVAGWGRRPSGERAAEIAAGRDLPCWRLEDAMLRSVGLGVRGAPPWGLMADPIGVYYDATRPSALERRLNGAWRMGRTERAHAERMIALWRRLRLSKYNPPAPPSEPIDGPYSVVVDQTRGDESIARGLASRDTFATMLREAMAEARSNGWRVVVRTHPDVLAGARAGHLGPDDLPAMGIDPARVAYHRGDARTLIEGAERVHCVTSLLGFEARLCGVPTRTHGLPFYAGWGGDDASWSERRRTRRDATEIFAAAYLDLPLYYDPHARERCDFERLARVVAELREEAARRATRTHTVGVTPWKRDFIALHLGGGAPGAFPPGHVTHHRTTKSAMAAARADGGRVAAWASRLRPEDRTAVRGHGIELVEIEDGFLRSRGRGAAFTHPGQLALDPLGIYYDPSRPSALEALIEGGDIPPGALARARTFIEAAVEAGATKYNLDDADPLPDATRYVLVVGQVEDDASIRTGAIGPVRTNLALLQATRAEHPSATIVYRPHPDVERGRRKGRVEATDLARLADHVAPRAPLPELIASAERLHAITSLAGLEALMRGRPVTCHGAPFYAGWGATEDRVAIPRRTRKASVTEIVAAAYLLYPSTVDPETRLFCRPELLMERIADPAVPWSVARLALRRLWRVRPAWPWR